MITTIIVMLIVSNNLTTIKQHKRVSSDDKSCNKYSYANDNNSNNMVP